MRSTTTAVGAGERVRFAITRGFDVDLAGAPEQRIDATPPEVESVALLADDFPGQGLTSLVDVGDRVRLGQPLAAERGRSDVLHASPGAGVVREVTRVEGRRATSIVIALEGAEEERYEVTAADALPALSAEEVKQRLSRCGLWPALRARPFDRVPDPAGEPSSIFVTALDSAPLAGSADVVLAEDPGAFAAGLRVLARLTSGPLHLCVRPGAPWPALEVERLRVAEFAGPHPAGLVGTHVHALDPVGPGRSVWYVGYQDALAIGRVFTSGRPSCERVVALAGPLVARPRLLRARLGASIEDLTRGELRAGESRLLSGSPLAGRQASGWGKFLGRYHTQVCALEERADEPGGGRRGPRRTTALNGRVGVFFPTAALERAVPCGLLAQPLLRALLVGDAERARALGCLELGEEDLALCTYVCPGKLEYGVHLRKVLQRLEVEP